MGVPLCPHGDSAVQPGFKESLSGIPRVSDADTVFQKNIALRTHAPQVGKFLSKAPADTGSSASRQPD
jgi:hypothetical protein